MFKFITFIFFGACMLALIFLGIDMEMARRDYNEIKGTGNVVSGCIYQFVCDRYNKMLERK